MTKGRTKAALMEAVTAARAAGALMRKNLHLRKRVSEETAHDIKLELDVRCQTLIERRLQRAFPGIAILGEEGALGDAASSRRWVVDPIDGTVNFSYGIPHACVSIALQERRAVAAPAFRARRLANHPDAHYETIAGVVYDPFCDELWAAIRGQRARLNGVPVRVSQRSKLAQTIVAIGFAKETRTIEKMVPMLKALLYRARKIRIMGSAALSLVYVASGRMDAYAEYGLRLWDIAAGGLILECAGGDFFHEPIAGEHTYRLLAHNGYLRSQLARL